MRKAKKNSLTRLGASPTGPGAARSGYASWRLGALLIAFALFSGLSLKIFGSSMLALGREALARGDRSEAREYFRYAAASLDPTANYYLGNLAYESLENGQTARQEAAAYWQRAALRGVTRAKTNLASLRALGIGTKKDVAAAMRLWQDAARDRDPLAQFNLGVADYVGLTGTANAKDALARWKRAAKHEVAAAHFNLGVAAIKSTSEHTDYSLAMQHWRLAALAGHEGARFNMGLVLSEIDRTEGLRDCGSGLAFGAFPCLDSNTALQTALLLRGLRLPAQNSRVQRYLGWAMLHLNPDGLSATRSTARGLLRSAADAGDSEAATMLAALDLQNAEVKDKNPALTHLESAARAKNPEAQYILGAYHLGRGGSKTQSAGVYLQRAATQGLPAAQAALASHYLTQDQGKSKLKDAKVMASRSARQGHPLGMLLIAEALSTAGEADLSGAYQWLKTLQKFAARETFDPLLKAEAENLLRQLSARLTPDQTSAANTFAAQFRPRLEYQRPWQQEMIDDMDLNFAFHDLSSELPKLVDPALKSTLETWNSGNKAPGSANGSAFAISSAHLVTSNHVVQSCAGIQVRHGRDSFPAKVEGFDELDDLAILKVEGAELKGIASLRLETKLGLGEEIFAMGYPLAGVLSSEVKMTSGMINSLAGIGGDVRHVQISAAIQPGSSGGPLLDHKAQVIGIITAKLNSLAIARDTGDLPENINFAIRADTLAAFVARHNLPLPHHDQGANLDSQEIAERASAFTYQVICLDENTLASGAHAKPATAGRYISLKPKPAKGPLNRHKTAP